MVKWHLSEATFLQTTLVKWLREVGLRERDRVKKERERERELCCQVTKNYVRFCRSWAALRLLTNHSNIGSYCLLDLPMPVSRPPTLEWTPRTAWHTHHSKVPSPWMVLRGKAPLSGGYTAWCAGTIQGKESRIQLLAGVAPSSQTVGSLFRVVHEQAKHSSWTTEANITLVAGQESSLSLSLTLC